ncbi:MAG: FadR family transcriptional regulator [Alphaproteobacteria bacterium]|nr:FadR family transcriptional regulator [Alphaproteobacteria bacterium]
MQKFDTLAKPPRLTDQIAQVLAQRIGEGELLPGERLPAEKDMAESFGVSRSVVREAVSMLKYDGLVETRQGSGVFVSSNPNTRSFRIESGLLDGAADLRAVFGLRSIVESAAAGLAAERRAPEDIAVLRGHLEAMATDIAAGREGVDADTAFHTAIARAADNAYLLRFAEFLGGALREAIGAARRNSAQFPGYPDAVQAEHRLIFDGIAAGDPEAAEAAMRQHVQAAMTRLGLTTKKANPEEINDNRTRRGARDSRPRPVAKAPGPGPAAA